MELNTFLAAVITTVSIIFAFGIIRLWGLRKNDDYWKKRGIPYNPRPNIIKLFRVLSRRPMHELFQEAYLKYGRIYGDFEFSKPCLIVSDPDLLRDILVKDFHAFSYRRTVVSGNSALDKMVSMLKGEDWKRVRTIMTPAFTSKRMRKMANMINECSQTVVDTFGKHSARGEPVDVKSIFGAFTMDVIARAAFATKIDSHNTPENVFVKNVKKIFFEPTLWIMLVFIFAPAWIILKLRLLASNSMDFFKDVIAQVIRERKEKDEKYEDMLQLLLDAQEEMEAEKSKTHNKNETQEDETDQFGSVTSSEVVTQKKYKKLSEDELVAQAVMFFIAGYETTASALTFLAYALAINPDCQEKVIKEVDEAYEKHKKFDYDVLREMKYLDYCVSETLRMYPFLTRFERTACENYRLGNTGIVIEKDTMVAFNVHAMHYDPEFFHNPEKFDPERFMPGNVSHPQYAYLPFGAGPRNCLGMRFALLEIKLCMCNILQNYRFKKHETTPIPPKYKPFGGLLTVVNLPLTAEKRKG